MMARRIVAWMWPLFRMVFPSTHVDGLEIVNVGLQERPIDSIGRHFKLALSLIEGAGADVKDILSTNVKRVAIVRGVRDAIVVEERKYGTSLTGIEGRDELYLSFRLIWVAMYIEGARTSRLGDHELRAMCYDRATALATRFPDRERWISYVEKGRAADRHVSPPL